MLKVSEKLQVSNFICNYNDTVTSLKGDISSMIPTYKSLVNEIQETLISPLITSKKSHVETQTTKEEKPFSPLIQRIGPTHPLAYPDPRLVQR